MPNRRLSHASVAQWPMNEYSRFPESLPALLDGSHHADELCTMYGVSWSGLEKYLAEVGGSSIDDELGRVRIIYR